MSEIRDSGPERVSTKSKPYSMWNDITLKDDQNNSTSAAEQHTVSRVEIELQHMYPIHSPIGNEKIKITEG